MEKIKFSIIMPCYNSSAWVKDAIESVINQNYNNWELIAINDGSTDNTLEILNSYAKKNNRIKVFSKENGGYATAVNLGIDNVSGTYFLMLGSDDYLSINLFNEVAKQISSNQPDIVTFRTMMCNGGGYLSGLAYGI